MLDIWSQFLSSDSFIPHGHCYLWKPGLVWLHLLSDTFIALAYYSIPLTLLYFVRRRQDLPFYWIFLLFSTFIVACGTTHLMAVWTLWHPVYWLSGALKAVTAIVSVFTAIVLIPIVPKALTLPSPAQLRQANEALQLQIADRIKAEQELKHYQIHLEQLVAERTTQIATSKQQVEASLLREQEARSQAETTKAELQIYVERLNLALDAAKMGSWAWDLSTDQLFWTPYHETIFGYEAGTPVRTYADWSNRVHPEDLPWVEKELQLALQNHTDFDVEHRVLLPNGQIRWIDGFGRATYTAQGNPVRMAGIVLDITQRKQAEATLRLSEETTKRQLAEIEAIYATAPVGLCVLDTQLRYIRINEYLAEINGFTIEQHIGQTVQEILGALGNIQAQFFQEVMEKGVPVLNQEVHGCLPKEPDIERDWLVNYYPLTDSQGGVMGINITVREITDLKRTEQFLTERAEELTRLNTILSQTTALLQERNQELDQFAYVVSHDLKAPLRAIANLSLWLEEDLADLLPAENRHQMELLRSRVYRMESLINGLLEYSRVGRMETAVQTVDVNQLLLEVVDSLSPNPAFTIDIASNLPTLTTKPLLMSQVFANLISNAVKHHHRASGRIQISVQEHAQFYDFAVADDGPGIDAQHHTKIFTIFQTLKPRDEQENTGVGLSIVKKIIETEGGTITLTSQLGAGSIFRFTWPKRPKAF
ncbi:MAG: PAS domain-containing protein [Scytolyngbya sp. HA4215-MV1]|jgi:PAS domain S-box-containing protein|nr:PAS domain-containing protein [Scytolyngbya sp. HA4215-MV1]